MEKNQKFSIRKIEHRDNPYIMKIIRDVMNEFGADPDTTVLGDPSINNMYDNYTEQRAVYYVLEDNNKILGGSGIRQLEGTGENIGELQRMFLLSEARGMGYGKALLNLCIYKAKEFKYDKIYLESLSQMKDAISLYQKAGFEKINNPLGSTGHSGCNVFMVLKLK